MATPFQVTFDAHDPDAQARFWSATLGYVLQPPPDGFDTWEAFAIAVGIPEDARGDLSAAVDPDGVGPRLFFQRVPEAKVVKNRVHLDVHITSAGMSDEARRAHIDSEVDRLVSLGAARVEDFAGATGIWTVMRDPEGNEFCVE